VTDLLQRLEDSVAHLRGELCIHPPASRYLTLHGGVGAMGDDLVKLYDDYKLLAQGLSATPTRVALHPVGGCWPYGIPRVIPGWSLSRGNHGGAPHSCVVLMTEWRPGRSWERVGQGWRGQVSNGRTAWSWILGCSRPRTSRLECSWSPPGALPATVRALFRPGNSVIYGTSPFSFWTRYQTKRLGT
jgi:hypothetical protein